MADGDTTAAPAGRTPWSLAPAYQGAVPFTQQFAGNPYMYNNGFDQAADLFKISGILPGAPGNPMLNNRVARYDFKRTGDVAGQGVAPYLAPWAQSPLGTDNHNSGPGYIPAVNPVLWGGTPGSGSGGTPSAPTPPWVPPPTPTNTDPSGAGGPIGGSPIKGGEVPGIVKTGGLLNAQSNGLFGAMPTNDTAGLQNYVAPQNLTKPAWINDQAWASVQQGPQYKGMSESVADPMAAMKAQGSDLAQYQWLNAHPQYKPQIVARMGPDAFAKWYGTIDNNGGAANYIGSR